MNRRPSGLLLSKALVGFLQYKAQAGLLALDLGQGLWEGASPRLQDLGQPFSGLSTLQPSGGQKAASPLPQSLM